MRHREPKPKPTPGHKRVSVSQHVKARKTFVNINDVAYPLGEANEVALAKRALNASGWTAQ